MPDPTMTPEQMIETLRARALKICQLSLEITTRNLAQAFADVQGHINHLSAVVRPIDATIPEDGSPRPELAALRLQLYLYHFHNQEEKEEHFREQLTEADQYIAYLDLILAKGKAVKVAAMRGAA